MTKPAKTLIQNRPFSSSRDMAGFWTVAIDSPKSLNIETNPTNEETIAMIPKSPGVNKRAMTMTRRFGAEI